MEAAQALGAQRPLLIVAGIPLKTTAKRGSFAYTRAGWDFIRCDSLSKDVDLRYCWRDVRRAVDRRTALGSAGVHVLAFHKNDRTRVDYTADIQPFHRIIFLPVGILSSFGSPLFAEAIDRFVSYEESWRELVMPKDTHEPLLLPESHFAAPRSFDWIWNIARTCSGDDDQLRLLNRSAAAFRVQLVRHMGANSGYIDNRGYFFVYNGARHGVAEQPRENWKINYLMPVGFHYDVSHERGHTMYFNSGRSSQSYSGHVNIYPHGQLR